MKRSESIAALAKALAQAQAEYPEIPKLHTGKVTGQGKNGPYEYSYHYADLVDTVMACRPINVKYGLAVSQAPGFVDGEDVLTTVLMHESGEWQESTRRLHAAKDDPQSAGSAITYARRYDYCAVLGIVADEDDDDGNAATRAARSRPNTSTNGTTRQTGQTAAAHKEDDVSDRITDAQKRYFEKLVAELHYDRHGICHEILGVPIDSVSSLSKAQANRVIDEMVKRKEAMT